MFTKVGRNRQGHCTLIDCATVVQAYDKAVNLSTLR